MTEDGPTESCEMIYERLDLVAIFSINIEEYDSD
jgi:hypothetical protein